MKQKIFVILFPQCRNIHLVKDVGMIPYMLYIKYHVNAHIVTFTNEDEPGKPVGKKATTIPWNEIEEKYAARFPGKKGMPAKPLRTALGTLIIQKQYEYSDRELVEWIRENPYYQFFI